MSVGQLGRITFGFAGDGFNAQFVDLSGRGRGKDYLKFQICKESIPERIILKHIQDSWKPHLSSDRLVLRERSIGKEFLIFIFEQVRHMVLILLFANATFAPVARDILTASGELIDGQTAVVGTAFAVGHSGFIFQSVDLFNREHSGCFSLLVSFSGNQSSAESAHDPGDIRTDGVAVRDLFKAAQYGVVVESTALDYNVFSKL